MKIIASVIGMGACLVLALASANAGAVLSPGLNQGSAGVNLERGAMHTADNFGRSEDQGNQDKHCDKGDRDHDCCDKDDKDHNCKHCEDGDHSDKGDKDHHCEKSPSKPYH
jgi:hypothetical protein